MSRDRLMEARKLIEAKRYEEGAAILRTLPNDPTAQKWLGQMEAKRVIKSFYPKPPDKDFILHLASGTVGSQDGSMAGWQSVPSNTRTTMRHLDGPSKPSDHELISEIVHTEQQIARLEREIAETDHKIHELKKGENVATPVIVVGLFLTPVGIGFIILLVAIAIAVGNPRQRRRLSKENEERIAELEAHRARLLELKYSLDRR